MTQIVVVQPGAVVDEVPSGPQYGVRYVLLGPDGTRAVFNDPTDPDYVGWLSEVSGLDSPEVRESADDLVGMDGGVHGDFLYGRRPVVLTGGVDNRPAEHHYHDDLTLVATNLFTNPSAENNVTDGQGWYDHVSTGATIHTTASRSTAWSKYGSASVYAHYENPDTTARTLGIDQNTGTAARIAVKPSTTYTISLDVNMLQIPAGSALYLGVVEFDSSSTQLGTNQGNLGTTLGERRLVHTFTTLSTTASLYFRCYTSADAAGERFEGYFDGLMLVEGSTDPGYFDGSTPGVGAYPYASDWTGTAHASTSRLYSVDRQPLSPNVVRNLRMTRLQQATNAMRKDAELRWAVEGGLEQVLSLRRQQPLRISGAFNKTFQAGMVAADPRIYSARMKEKQGAPSTNIEADNVGTTGTLPTLTIYGPITNPVVTNQSTGEQMSLTYTLAAGSNITIDFKTKTILLNGGTSIYSAMNFPTSSWFELTAGVNTLQLTGSSTTASTSLKVNWQDAWA